MSMQPLFNAMNEIACVVYLSPHLNCDGICSPLRADGTEVRILDDGWHPSKILEESPAVLVLDAFDYNALAKERAHDLQHIPAEAPIECIFVDNMASPLPGRAPTARGGLQVPASLPGGDLVRLIRWSAEHAQLKARVARLESDLGRRSRELEELNDIGVALSAERNLEILLEMILQKSREITSADAGSLYLVETKDSTEERYLRFMLSQNDSLDTSYEQFTMPMDEASIAGYVAMQAVTLNIVDVYEIERDVSYRFNKSFDESFGYVTKSMLTVPMKNTQGEVLGVIQLINCKHDFSVKLLNEGIVDATVVPFDERSQELVNSLASQAAVALENNLLYKKIEDLLEAFLRASVSTIESRDPPTSGHSERVAILTVALAEATSNTQVGKYRNLVLSSDQIKELRWASLLHDYGKIGVRENVLVKAKKLYEWDMNLIKARYDFIKRTAQFGGSKQEIEHILSKSREDYEQARPEFVENLSARLKEIDDMLMTILQANQPALLPVDVPEALRVIAQCTFEDMNGEPRRYLEDWEVKTLSIPKGSLDENERKEIESHVTHSFHFLRQLPWTNELKNLPQIAYAHHEKLDGSGYPRGLKELEIPVQAKMMTISDIYDALTAADRPYKNRVPIPRALDILRDEEAGKGKLDQELLNIFIDRKIFELTTDWKKA